MAVMPWAGYLAVAEDVVGVVAGLDLRKLRVFGVAVCLTHAIRALVPEVDDVHTVRIVPGDLLPDPARAARRWSSSKGSVHPATARKSTLASRWL